MRIPLTKYGWPQVAIFPAAVLTVMTVFLLGTMAFLSPWLIVSVEMLLAIVLIWVLAFFRDPHRAVPAESNLLLAPADGKITNIEIVDENDFIDGKVLRIGIFLSILNVHINRAPCNVKVEKITYKQGKYKNAMTPQAGQVNESNDLGLVRTDIPKERLIVRQISGAIARRIVCRICQGQKLTGGEKFGMIKFGSRTELYLPARENAKCLVQIGDKVKAGLTPLVKYE
ncbi:MAG: phosphatidylserine decarboxylase [Planctomycetota bacterium]|jgi:phosphatidylserine decarboxylase